MEQEHFIEAGAEVGGARTTSLHLCVDVTGPSTQHLLLLPGIAVSQLKYVQNVLVICSVLRGVVVPQLCILDSVDRSNHEGWRHRRVEQ